MAFSLRSTVDMRKEAKEPVRKEHGLAARMGIPLVRFSGLHKALASASFLGIIHHHGTFHFRQLAYFYSWKKIKYPCARETPEDGHARDGWWISLQCGFMQLGNLGTYGQWSFPLMGDGDLRSLDFGYFRIHMQALCSQRLWSFACKPGWLSPRDQQWCDVGQLSSFTSKAQEGASTGHQTRAELSSVKIVHLLSEKKP